MRRKFKLSITSFDIVGGIHNYGSVYLDGVKVHECEQPDPRDAPKWWANDPDRAPWMTIKFATPLDVAKVAKEWFLSAPTVNPGDILTVWRGYFSKEELKQLKVQSTRS
jgi:hypothetical protein